MKEKILIVDDEPEILEILNRVLSEEGYNVKTASGGEDAISIFESEYFDLVITDMRMPGTDGAEVLRCWLLKKS